MLPMWLRYLFRVMRPASGPRNVFIFAAVVFDRKMFDTSATATSGRPTGLILFYSACCRARFTSSTTWSTSTRIACPVKRNRPLAAGVLPAAGRGSHPAITVLLAIVLRDQLGAQPARRPGCASRASSERRRSALLAAPQKFALWS
jgi:hypothetical protein